MNIIKMKYNIIVLAALTCLLAACSGNHKPVDLADNKKTDADPYKTGTVTEKALSGAARLPGQLQAFYEVNIFPKVNGFVKNLYVDRGSVVTKGQLLAVLEAPELDAQFQAANSRYLQAQENAVASKEKYERLKEAAKEPGSVSVLDLDDAQARMKADQAMVNSERSNVESVRTMAGYLKIYAPFDGVITQRNISPGTLVSPGKTSDLPMLVLQDINKLRLVVYIPEDYVDKVDLDQPVTYTLNAMPGQPHKAKISRSANALSTLHQEAIEIDVINKKNMLKPGMYAEVDIPMLSGAKSLLVPNSAIVRSTEREYVIAVDNGKTNYVDVKDGLNSHDSTEVFGNLKPGNTIITNANDEIKEGISVK
ncbi:MAG TPA: efflux RND transporter periplasmic adaptor subunit [Mucilaginibacter sp.]|nr:efflux RND transporter periplasmic adaptor subunit [Mucilaginibacter sp.]